MRRLFPAVGALVAPDGGKVDQATSAKLKRETAGLIRGSQLVLYPDHGHGNELENADYDVQISRFAQRIGEPTRARC